MLTGWRLNSERIMRLVKTDNGPGVTFTAGEAEHRAQSITILSFFAVCDYL